MPPLTAYRDVANLTVLIPQWRSITTQADLSPCLAAPFGPSICRYAYFRRRSGVFASFVLSRSSEAHDDFARGELRSFSHLSLRMSGSEDSLDQRKYGSYADSSPDLTKRRRVGRACDYCHRSHLMCDMGRKNPLKYLFLRHSPVGIERPCRRCIKRGAGHLCLTESSGSTLGGNIVCGKQSSM